MELKPPAMAHPSVAEQEEAMSRALSKVTWPALEALLLRSGYELLAYELRPVACGS